MGTNDVQPLLQELSPALGELHRTLVEHTRSDYELERGPAAIAGGLLHLLINDPYFAWLRPLSELMVDLDVLLEGGAAPGDSDAAAVRDELETLLGAPEKPAQIQAFTPRYVSLVASDPHVAMAHARVRQIVRRLPEPGLDPEAEVLEDSWRSAKRRRR